MTWKYLSQLLSKYCTEKKQPCVKKLIDFTNQVMAIDMSVYMHFSKYMEKNKNDYLLRLYTAFHTLQKQYNIKLIAVFDNPHPRIPYKLCLAKRKLERAKKLERIDAAKHRAKELSEICDHIKLMKEEEKKNNIQSEEEKNELITILLSDNTKTFTFNSGDADKVLQELEQKIEKEKYSIERHIEILPEHYEAAKELLASMNIPIIVAQECHEADHVIGSLKKKGICDYSLTTDGDHLRFKMNVVRMPLSAMRFGDSDEPFEFKKFESHELFDPNVNMLINEYKKLSEEELKKRETTMIEYESVIKQLNITHDQLIDLCWIMGCDYTSDCKGLPGMGIKSLDAIKTYGDAMSVWLNHPSNPKLKKNNNKKRKKPDSEKSLQREAKLIDDWDEFKVEYEMIRPLVFDSNVNTLSHVSENELNHLASLKSLVSQLKDYESDDYYNDGDLQMTKDIKSILDKYEVKYKNVHSEQQEQQNNQKSIEEKSEEEAEEEKQDTNKKLKLNEDTQTTDIIYCSCFD